MCFIIHFLEQIRNIRLDIFVACLRVIDRWMVHFVNYTYHLFDIHGFSYDRVLSSRSVLLNSSLESIFLGINHQDSCIILSNIPYHIFHIFLLPRSISDKKRSFLRGKLPSCVYHRLFTFAFIRKTVKYPSIR